MTWEQKLQAIIGLAGAFNVSLRMREPGNWYVSVSGTERKVGDSLLSSIGLTGRTPEYAVDETWRSITDGQVLVVRSTAKTPRKTVKWNGYMWEEVSE